MTLRTSRTSVMFAEPFHLKAFAQALPRGDYEVEIDEEVIEGNDRTIYRRVATGLRVREGGKILTYPVDADDLAEALARDQHHYRPAAPLSADMPTAGARFTALSSCQEAMDINLALGSKIAIDIEHLKHLEARTSCSTRQSCAGKVMAWPRERQLCHHVRRNRAVGNDHIANAERGGMKTQSSPVINCVSMSC